MKTASETGEHPRFLHGTPAEVSLPSSRPHHRPAARATHPPGRKPGAGPHGQALCPPGRPHTHTTTPGCGQDPRAADVGEATGPSASPPSLFLPSGLGWDLGDTVRPWPRVLRSPKQAVLLGTGLPPGCGGGTRLGLTWDTPPHRHRRQAGTRHGAAAKSLEHKSHQSDLAFVSASRHSEQLRCRFH